MPTREVTGYLDACQVPLDVGRTIRRMVSVHMVNILTQMRKADKELEELLQSFLDMGQLSQGIATILTEPEARAYLEVINKVYRSQHRIEDLVPVWESSRSGKNLYIILVAGERRYNACHIGASRIKARKIEPTIHFDGRYAVEMRFGLTAHEALKIQLTENTYNPPRPAESAVSHWRVWRCELELNAQLTVPQFARSVNRNPDWMRSALRFAELPDCLQQLAHEDKKKGGLPFMTLAEIGRYYEAATLMGKPPSEEKLKGIATYLWTKQLKPKEVREFVNVLIEQASGKVPELFAPIDYGSDEGALLASKSAAQRLSNLHALAGIDYFDGMLAQFRAGNFGQHHPLRRGKGASADSAHNAVARLVSSAETLVETLDQSGTPRGKPIRAKALEVLPQVEDAMLALGEPVIKAAE